MNILICEDQEILLDSISTMLEKNETFNIIGKLNDASDILDFLKNNNVDLILTDICTKNNNISLNFVNKVKSKYPHIKIVVMTALPEISFIEKAKNANVDSFIYKNIGIDEMIGILISTYHGYNIYPGEKKNTKNEFSDINNQEEKILRLFCEGYERKEIADIMHLSENSIKFHIKNLLTKTGFSSMSRLAIYAISNGYIVVG